MKKVTSIISAAVAVAVFVGPVFAQSPININANKANQKAGNTITNGSPSAGASAVGVGSVTTTTSAGAISGSTSGVNSTINANTKSGPATTVSGAASTNSGSISNSQGQGQQQKQKVQDSGNSVVTVEGDRQASIPGIAPAIFAPGLTAGAYTCLGAKSGGLSLGVPGGVGVGGTFGSTVESERCNARADAATLTGLGDVETAKARLCQVEAIAQAYETAGKPCAKPVQPQAAKTVAPVAPVQQVTAVDSTNFGSRGATQGN